MHRHVNAPGRTGQREQDREVKPVLDNVSSGAITRPKTLPSRW